MESYGLTATAVTAVSDAGTPITLSLADVPADSTANTVEADIRARTLYLLDRFGVSDEFYHELAQVRICAVASTYMYMYVLTHRDIRM